MFPILAAARIRVKEDHRHPAASRILVPEPHSGKIRIGLARLWIGQNRPENDVNQQADSLQFALPFFPSSLWFAGMLGDAMSTVKTQIQAGEAVHRRYWIFSPAQDLAFVLLTPLLILGTFALARRGGWMDALLTFA